MARRITDGQKKEIEDLMKVTGTTLEAMENMTGTHVWGEIQNLTLKEWRDWYITLSDIKKEKGIVEEEKATERQIAYLKVLCEDNGQRFPNGDITKKQASSYISQLLTEGEISY